MKKVLWKILLEIMTYVSFVLGYAQGIRTQGVADYEERFKSVKGGK